MLFFNFLRILSFTAGDDRMNVLTTRKQKISKYHDSAHTHNPMASQREASLGSIGTFTLKLFHRAHNVIYIIHISLVLGSICI